MHADEFITTQLIEADERLNDVWRHVYGVRQSKQAPATVHRQLMPNYEMLLVFNFGPDIAISLGGDTYAIERTAAIGPLQKVLHYDVLPGADFMAVVFTLNGFYRLLGHPIDQLAGMTVFDPDRLSADNCFQNLWAEMAPMRSFAERVDYLSEYALLYVAPADEDTHTVMDGVPLFANLAVDPVKAIAEMRQLTPRSVQTRFKTNLGITAKDLSRFLRFKKLIINLIEQYPTPPDWADLVYTFGYHDQSHLIRDFRHFTDRTPSEFIRQLAGENICLTQPGAHY